MPDRGIQFLKALFFSSRLIEVFSTFLQENRIKDKNAIAENLCIVFWLSFFYPSRNSV
jgi:hypothetical protein